MKLKDWNRLPPSESTQKIGYKWISRSKFAVLKVAGLDGSGVHALSERGDIGNAMLIPGRGKCRKSFRDFG
jgi:hypothetical protein